jgi:siroheme synthase-like protein
MYYPVALDLREKRCLVVGGGTIATDKVEGLLAAGAEVRVVAPDASLQLRQLAAEGHIALLQRLYTRNDLEGIYLAYGATDDTEVNARVAEDARSAGILVNAVDDIPNCDFFAMAITRRGDLQIAISTNGRSPAFARWMREYLDTQIPEEWADLLSILGEVRAHVKARGPVPEYGHWRAAITDEVLAHLRDGDVEWARESVLQAIMTAAEYKELAENPVPAGWSAAS